MIVVKNVYGTKVTLVHLKSYGCTNLMNQFYVFLQSKNKIDEKSNIIL